MSDYKLNQDDLELFVDILMLINDKEEYEKFLVNLLSTTELSSITQRVKIAHMLQEGKKYSEITEETKASTTTISRVNKVLTSENNLFYTILKRLKQKSLGLKE